MADDPRERIETNCLFVALIPDADTWDVDGGYVDWSEVVELAQKILAADEAWKKAARCCRMATVICDHYLPDSRGDCRQCQHSEACHAAALAEIAPVEGREELPR